MPLNWQVKSNMMPNDLYSPRTSYWLELLAALKHCVSSPSNVDSDVLNQKISDLRKEELCFGFPGESLIIALTISVEKNLWTTALTTATNIVQALQSNSYRLPQNNIIKGSHLKPMQFGTQVIIPSRNDRRNTCYNYFEVLVFCTDQSYREWLKNQYSIIENSKDDFHYSFIFVDNEKDTIDALKINYDILSCLIVENDNNAIDDNCTQERHFLIHRLHAARSDISLLLISDNIEEGEKPSLIERAFRKNQPFYDLHYYLLKIIRNLYCTPFFDALRDYSDKPKISFHALPISRAASIHNSYWATDFYHFYGSEVFSAETSSTQGGLDSLLDPKGPIKQACDKAAQTFGALETYFITSGTSTSNKIVLQANLNPGDIVLVGADCHKSIPSSIVLTGADVIYLETYPLEKYDLYGAVYLEEILSVLEQLYQENQLHRVKQISLTNCTFDGILYNVELFMMSILAIKPDIIFHWDEAWFAHGHFHRQYNQYSAMKTAKKIELKIQSPEYHRSYQLKRESQETDINRRNGTHAWTPNWPDPKKVIIRVYATQSTHKSLTAFRQAAMIHIYDRALDRERFIDSYRMHTTTSPSYQNIASLDIARRQVSLEGYRLIDQSLKLANTLRDTISERPILNRCFTALTWQDLVGDKDQRADSKQALLSDALLNDSSHSFYCDPTRVLLDISTTGMDGALFREVLMTRYNIQVNKSSANTVLFIVNIGVTEEHINHLIMVLSQIAEGLLTVGDRTKKRLKRVMPKNRIYSEKYRSFTGSTHQALKLRSAYYDTHTSDNIRFRLLNTKLIESIESGREYVSAGFVTPYPPGYPVLLPGQVITAEIVKYLMSLEIREIHGYNEQKGLRIFIPQEPASKHINLAKNLREASCEVN